MNQEGTTHHTARPNPQWDVEIVPTVYGDPHISGRWGFELFTGVGAEDDFVYDSGLVYSSEDDAKQAADDAAHAAWRYQGHCWQARAE